MARFIAHVVMQPNEGGAPYTVETDFSATGYPTAWEHISKLGLRFDAKIVSHRLQLLGDETDGGSECMLLLPGPKEGEKPALTVNVEPAVKFYGEAAVACPEIVPFPYEEEKNDDPVAA